jgi:hypothetical protein
MDGQGRLNPRPQRTGRRQQLQLHRPQLQAGAHFWY